MMAMAAGGRPLASAKIVSVDIAALYPSRGEERSVS